MKNILLGALLASALFAAAVAVAVQLGLPDFAADRPHSDLTHRLIEWARERSVSVRSASVVVPDDLTDSERVRRGAGNYDAMCVGCHLSPGIENTEIRRGLYPEPPDLSKSAEGSGVVAADARRFWIVKHGIKGSAMPAWSKGGMEDTAIWDLVAFTRALPGLSAEQYKNAVAASEGHAHGGLDHVEDAAAPSPPQPDPPDAKPHPHDHGTHPH
ncbi:MAG: cytochrome c [Pseudomonadota bacterium]